MIKLARRYSIALYELAEEENKFAEYREEINNLLGAELEEEYLSISEIFTEAAFSNHEISEEKIEQALVFQQKLLSKLKTSKGLKERLYLKYKYYLY